MVHPSPPAKLNLILAFAITGIFACCLTAPLFFNLGLGSACFLAAITIPFNTPFWSLIHEAIHKNFHANTAFNNIAGRALSILFGAAFGILRFGHLMHHQYNRQWESEYYSGTKLFAKYRATLSHYFYLLGGLYLTEIAMTLLIAVLPVSLSLRMTRKIFPDDRHYQAAVNSVLKAQNTRSIRIDCVLILALYTGLFYLYGDAWIVPAIYLIGRGFMVSVMDNSYHYGTPEDNSVPAKELETTKWYSKFILHFNHHKTHHQNVKLPWTHLPDDRIAAGRNYDEALSSAVSVQFKGPIQRAEDVNL